MENSLSLQKNMNAWTIFSPYHMYCSHIAISHGSHDYWLATLAVEFIISYVTLRRSRFTHFDFENNLNTPLKPNAFKFICMI